MPALAFCRRQAPRQNDTAFVRKELLRFFSPGLHEDRGVVGLWYAEKKGLAALAEAKLRRENFGVANSRAADELREAAQSPEMFIRIGRNGIFRTMLILPDKVRLEFGKILRPVEDAEAPAIDETREEHDGVLQSRNTVPVKFVVFKEGSRHRMFYYEGNHRIEARREFGKPEELITRYETHFSKMDSFFPD